MMTADGSGQAGSVIVLIRHGQTHCTVAGGYKGELTEIGGCTGSCVAGHPTLDRFSPCRPGVSEGRP
jgi:hypothetical protein